MFIVFILVKSCINIKQWYGHGLKITYLSFSYDVITCLIFLQIFYSILWMVTIIVKYQYPIRDSAVVLGSIPKLKFVHMLLYYITLALIGSQFIYLDTCPWVMMKIVCRPYSNQTRVFSCPTDLKNVVVRVLVGRAHLSSVVDNFWYTKGSRRNINHNLLDQN